jgi:hypothetical protein
MLIRRSALHRVGLFNPKLRLGMVIEWYARSRDAGLNEVMLSDVVYRRWVHEANMTVRLADQHQEYAAALRSVLERRRNNRQGLGRS